MFFLLKFIVGYSIGYLIISVILLKFMTIPYIYLLVKNRMLKYTSSHLDLIPQI